MEVTQAVIARGEAVVPLLREILFDTTVGKPDPQELTLGDTLGTRETEGDLDVSLYAISALQAIGSRACFDIQIDCALSHLNPDARSASLVSLGHTFHDRVASGVLEPDLRVVHALLQCVDDQQVAPLYQRTIGSIAREALDTWTGMDLGDPSLDPSKAIVGKERTEMTWQAYRELWWSNVSSKLAWSSTEARFTIAKP